MIIWHFMESVGDVANILEISNMTVDIQRLISKIKKQYMEMDDKFAENYAAGLLDKLDSRLVQNLVEWMEGKTITDIWVGKYCVNAIMSIRDDSDFLSALEAMNTYLSDEEAGIILIWRGKR